MKTVYLDAHLQFAVSMDDDASVKDVISQFIIDVEQIPDVEIETIKSDFTCYDGGLPDDGISVDDDGTRFF